MFEKKKKNDFRNLGNNIFPNLPKTGLQRILHLKTFNNPKLREFPPPETFPRIQVNSLDCPLEFSNVHCQILFTDISSILRLSLLSISATCHNVQCK